LQHRVIAGGALGGKSLPARGLANVAESLYNYSKLAALGRE